MTGLALSSLSAQTNIEPGLEKAVNWKWRVAPSEPSQWVPILPEATPVPVAEATPEPVSEMTYEVKKGDALVIIARKYGLLPVHLKTYNGLTSDLIHIGQILKIPTRTEAVAIAPLPEPPRKTTKKKKGEEDAALTREMMDVIALQAFLDRRQFTAGPVDGIRGPGFEKVVHLFQLTYPDAKDPAKLGPAMKNEVGDGTTHYALKETDFRYIIPPKAERPAAATPPASPASAKADAKKTALHGPSYDDLAGADKLLYRTPWEFVAERFHCSEALLKKLNSHIKAAPIAGTEFRVPNVIPFEIEKGFRGVIQPPAGVGKVKADILDLSFLQIYQKDFLVAMMPISMARPGLRGKGSWTVMDAIPLPRMGTFQEQREQAQKPKPLFGQPEPDATPEKAALLAKEQFLAPGPNNPVGVIWINLAKADSSEPLPYGLHGTSIPDQMQNHYGIGGIQMTNWDIVRAARLLPPGTELEWKQSGFVPAPGAAPAAVPAAVPAAAPATPTVPASPPPIPRTN